MKFITEDSQVLTKARMMGINVPIITNDYLPIFYLRIIHNNLQIGGLVYNHYPVKSLKHQVYIVYIRELYIYENYRRKGLGKLSVKYFIKSIKKSQKTNPISSIQLEAENSKEFWSKCDFIPTGVISKEGNTRMIYQIKC